MSRPKPFEIQKEGAISARIVGEWKTQRLLRVAHTTNVLERASREVRRRTQPVGVLPNAESVARIMYGVTQHLGANWEEHTFGKFNRTLDVAGRVSKSHLLK